MLWHPQATIAEHIPHGVVARALHVKIRYPLTDLKPDRGIFKCECRARVLHMQNFYSNKSGLDSNPGLPYLWPFRPVAKSIALCEQFGASSETANTLKIAQPPEPWCVSRALRQQDDDAKRYT